MVAAGERACACACACSCSCSCARTPTLRPEQNASSGARGPTLALLGHAVLQQLDAGGSAGGNARPRAVGQCRRAATATATATATDRQRGAGLHRAEGIHHRGLAGDDRHKGLHLHLSDGPPTAQGVGGQARIAHHARRALDCQGRRRNINMAGHPRRMETARAPTRVGWSGGRKHRRVPARHCGRRARTPTAAAFTRCAMPCTRRARKKGRRRGKRKERKMDALAFLLKIRQKSQTRPGRQARACGRGWVCGRRGSPALRRRWRPARRRRRPAAHPNPCCRGRSDPLLGWRANRCRHLASQPPPWLAQAWRAGTRPHTRAHVCVRRALSTRWWSRR